MPKKIHGRDSELYIPNTNDGGHPIMSILMRRIVRLGDTQVRSPDSTDSRALFLDWALPLWLSLVTVHLNGHS